jgi:murein DD-endopeptidase MepM/ murein hydrolase activator NlpD
MLIAIKQCLSHYFKSLTGLVLVLTCSNALAFQITILNENPVQGSLIVGQLSQQGDVYLGDKKLKQDAQGYFVFGVGREAKSPVKLKYITDAGEFTQSITIGQRDWKIERVDGLPPAKVSPKKPKVLARIRKEAALVRKARQVNSELTNFKSQFIWPAKGRISGVYGSQRVLNGEPKRPHFGLDIANAIGEPVVAPASGRVVLVHPNMFYSGGTLLIDHGFGVTSTYIHLDTVDVKNGDWVEQGQKIATIGKTGRATGPHLDWRLNWFDVRLDPQLLLKTSTP